jgi:predicted nucleic acid-binding Zn ribbon protein
MPTYTYETIPAYPFTDSRRFEVRQTMAEPALTKDPETGERVRRVISGGLAAVSKSKSGEGPECGPDNCGCGRFS